MTAFSYTLAPTLTADNLKAAALARLLLIIPTDIALDPQTGDIEIPVRILRGADAVLQRVWIRLRMFLGEWFLDQRLGFPWRERVLIKGADVRDVKQLLVRAIEATPGVVRCDELTTSLNTQTRVLVISKMLITLDDGQDGVTIEAKQGAPYIVQ